jgi:hypothetical protein
MIGAAARLAMSDVVLRKFFMVRKPKSETVSLPEGANAPRELGVIANDLAGHWLPFPKSSSVDRLEPTIFLTSNLHSSLRRIQSGRARKQPDQVLLPIIVLLGTKTAAVYRYHRHTREMV